MLRKKNNKIHTIIHTILMHILMYFTFIEYFLLIVVPLVKKRTICTFHCKSDPITFDCKKRWKEQRRWPMEQNIQNNDPNLTKCTNRHPHRTFHRNLCIAFNFPPFCVSTFCLFALLFRSTTVSVIGCHCQITSVQQIAVNVCPCVHSRCCCA